MRYWLLKSEPNSYSIDDLKRDGVEPWDGVRNYQARNIMRNEMKKGDLAFFYHSSTEPVGIVGLCEIASREAYPDPTQFDSKDHHYDPKSKKDDPTWLLVDVKFREKFKQPITLRELKNDPAFNDMVLTQKGMRLSIQPVKEKHFKKIIEMAGK